MTRFIFTAKSSASEQVSGTLEAESETEALNKITKNGFFPLSLRKEQPAEQDSFFSPTIRKKELTGFTRELANLISAGVSILNSLALIEKETQNPQFRAMLKTVIESIKGGKTFSESLERYPRLFTEIYTSMIKTGEASGNLKEILKNLSEFMEKEEEFKETVLSALIYPFFVMAIGLLTVIILLVFVVPGLITMFADMGQSLPLPTRILIGLSEGAVSFGPVIALAAAAMVVFLKFWLATTKGKLLYDELRIKAGLLGDISMKTEISRLMKSLSLLLSSGMIITSALDKACAITANSYLRGRLETVKRQLREGGRFSQALKALSLFPESMLNILSIGEETGSLDGSLRHVSEQYEQEIARKLKIFTRILEPLIILLIGSVVAFIIIAMLLPIFEINFLVK